MSETEIKRIAQIVPVSDELLADARQTQAAWHRWMTATPEQRAQWAEWADDQKRQRAAERAAAERTPLTIGRLLDKLGFSYEYAVHLVQPYCECYDGRDGWEHCEHARDEGLAG